MLFVRPVKKSDYKDIKELANLAGFGMTSLPNDEKVLKAKIQKSIQSFKNKTPTGNEAFTFVLYDSEKDKAVGIASIVSHVGLTKPFYSYKISTIVQASDSLGHFCEQKVLHMVNDYTGATEIGGLFLHPNYRKPGVGKLLSKSRLLFMAQFPKYFSDTIISEIRGVHDENGESPFYNHLAKHFINLPFKDADYKLATEGGQFVTDLMPKNPIYVTLLHQDAQNVISKPLIYSVPAMQMLKNEGFKHRGYVDLFDAGPTLEADRIEIKSIKHSRLLFDNFIFEPNRLIATCDFNDFKVALDTTAHLKNETVIRVAHI